MRRRNGQVNESPHLARFLLVDELQRVEILDFRGEIDRVARGVESRDWPDTAGTCQQLAPDFLRGVANSTDESKACNDDAASHWLFACLSILFDVIDGILDGLDLLGVFVGNLEVKGLFKLHYQFHHVQRVSAKVFLEACIGGNLGLVDLKLLDDNLLHFFFNCHVSFSSKSRKVPKPVGGNLKGPTRSLPYLMQPAPCLNRVAAKQKLHSPETSSLTGWAEVCKAKPVLEFSRVFVDLGR